MRFKPFVFLAFLFFLFTQTAKAGKKPLRQLNATIEEFVSTKAYAKAIQFCNAELQKSNVPNINRFLIVSKCRLFAKSRQHLDSIPLLYSKQQALFNNREDSLHLFLNGRSLEILGHYYFLTKQVDSSINYLRSADSAYAFSGVHSNRIYNLNMLGTIYHLQENFSDALYCQLQALDLLNRFTPDDTNTLINLKNDIGLVYFKLQQYDKALAYYNSVMNMELSDIQLAQVLNNLGIIFIEQKKYELAKTHLEQALTVYKKLNRLKDLSLIYNNLGSVLEEMKGNNDTIFGYFNTSVQLKKVFNDSAGMVTTYLNLSSFQLERDFIKKAGLYLDSAMSLKTFFQAQDFANAFLNKSKIAEKSGNYKNALRYYNSFHTYQDSANQLKDVWQLKKAETEIEMNKQQQEIALLKKERQIKDIADSKKDIIFYAGTGILIFTTILLSIIAFSYYKKQRYQHKIRTREVKLASITNLVKGQEEERLRMAKELHDGVGNCLAILNAEITRDFTEKNKGAILTLLSQTSEEVRNITHDLMPITVKKLGLKEAIHDLVDKWRHSSNLVIDVNMTHESFGIDKDEELTIYRIIQELVKNSVQHGEASYILLNISKKKDKIILQFKDNGHGIDAKVKAAKGIGFKNISSRVAFLNGTFDMESDANGVRMKFIFSIPKHENSNR